jgi:hypothetical protein
MMVKSKGIPRQLQTTVENVARGAVKGEDINE